MPFLYSYIFLQQAGIDRTSVMQAFKRQFKNLKLLPVQMTDNSTMFFVNLDNFLISIVGIHPGIFLKRLIKNVLIISSVETNVVCHDGV